MKMYKTFLKQIASLQIILGWVILAPAIVAAIYGEWRALVGFIISGVLVAASGYAIYRLLSDTEEPKYKHSLAIVAIGWLMIIVVGSLPYLVIAWITPPDDMQRLAPAGSDYMSSLIYFRNPLHCLFESASAFTSTGLTMAVHEPSVGRGVLFYRHFSQWVGGAGFVVMALAVFRQLPGQGAISLYQSEASGDKLRANVIQTARAIWRVYLFITVVVFVYLVVGAYFILPDYPFSENVFDALNHAMAAQSAGGFSTLDDGIASYQSDRMTLLYILPMLLASFSLPFFYRFFVQRQVGELWRDIQARSVLIASLLGGIALSLVLLRYGVSESPFLDGVFHFVSALSTTGWQTMDMGKWPDFPILIMVGAMIVGGSAGGTVGGIKIIRALLLQKGLSWRLNRIFLPDRSIHTVRFNHKILLPEEMNDELARAGTFTLMYLLFVAVSTMITVYFMPSEYTLADAIFESASVQGTAGITAGITNPDMSPIVETVYIVQMWAGRIEIVPLLILFRVLLRGTKPKTC